MNEAVLGVGVFDECHKWGYKLKKFLLASLAAPHILTCGQLRLNNIPLCHVTHVH